MASQRVIFEDAFPAGADLSGAQHRFVVFSGGQIVQAGAGVLVLGVLQNKPDAAGKSGTVAILGTAKIEAGAAFSQFAELMSDASGRAVTATSTNRVAAIALAAAGAAGEKVPCLLVPAGRVV